jgi:hypothetical protein
VQAICTSLSLELAWSSPHPYLAPAGPAMDLPSLGKQLIRAWSLVRGVVELALRGYDPVSVNVLLERIHNPRGRTCGCDADCWCRRTAAGRAVKWWFPGRFVGLHHKNAALEAWKRDYPEGAAEQWKRERAGDE